MKKLVFLSIFLVFFLSGCIYAKPKISTFPSHDVKGKDISIIPRYKGSIRFGYSESKCHQSVKYYLKGNYESNVNKFYLNYFNSTNWTMKSKNVQQTAIKLITYSFKKGHDSIYLEIILEKEYTIIDISYTNGTCILETK